MARDLKRVLAALPPAREAAAFDWTRTLTASSLFDSPTEVEAWFLAQDFMVRWIEWTGVVNRYSRCFGQWAGSLPIAWYRLQDRCERMGHALRGSESLAAQLRGFWMEDLDASQPGANASLDQRLWAVARKEGAREAALAFSSPEGFARLRLPARWVARPATLSWEDEHQVLRSEWRPPAAEQTWAATAATLRLLDAGRPPEIMPDAAGVPDALVYHVRRYRSAMLQFSWLDDRPEWVRAGTQERLESRSHPMNWINGVQGGLELDPNTRGVLEGVFGRVMQAVDECGYETFADIIADSDFVGGADSPVGAHGINLIPSSRHGACASIVLAVAKGAGKSSQGFPKIMQRLKAHLIKCAGVTKVAVILCDTWDAAGFMDDHFDELKEHHRKGVRFVVLMAGAPGRALTPVPVDFLQAP